MLQQTRANVVAERFPGFMQRFRSLRTLAAAPVADVLAAWSGLGYYRRARALHEAAREVVTKYWGRLPRSAAELRRLPGIGRYTAAAIASIAFGEPCAVVDGNVERVLRRVLKRPHANTATLWNVAAQLLAAERPGDFNQAMMELGATICVPGRPHCSECPVRSWCRSRGVAGRRGSGSRTAVQAIRKDAAYALALRRQEVYLVQRDAAASLMPGMWELPEILPDGGPAILTLRHAITITNYHVSVFRIEPRSCQGGRWIRRDRVSTLPLTGLARKILRRVAVI